MKSGRWMTLLVAEFMQIVRTDRSVGRSGVREAATRARRQILLAGEFDRIWLSRNFDALLFLQLFKTKPLSPTCVAPFMQGIKKTLPSLSKEPFLDPPTMLRTSEAVASRCLSSNPYRVVEVLAPATLSEGQS